MNEVLSKEKFYSPENQNRDSAIVGYRKVEWVFAGFFHTGIVSGMHFTADQVRADIIHAKQGIDLGYTPPDNYEKGLLECNKFLIDNSYRTS